MSVIANPPLGEMIQMMRQVMISGTGTRAHIAGFDMAGKTGTTSDYKDAWFVGFTGGFTAAVWVGRDDDTPMRRVTGGSVPAEIWRNFMAATLQRLAASPIPGGAPPPPAAAQDAIGDMIENAPASGPDAEAPPDAQSPDNEGPATIERPAPGGPPPL